ncbi:DUF6071 family protein [Kitasatospora viridis]|uniref:GDSL-like lipase/acylhydrolase family protein n=1 Tax=Kitasatospora viridis TaxID=281105 RepID=A0A561T697_9ACTN|nr:DUF6071 family protein [Kitasatospora viridis]TWF82636.1 hypothetical protein FHX73_14118 [Kitasatospora viridis]
MYLYANGCSMTYGSELRDDPVTKTCSDNSYRWKHSWPGSLAQLTDAQGAFNDAWPSGSNDRVVRTTVQFVLEHWLGRGLPADGLLVVIGWSHPARREFFVDGAFRQVVPHHGYDIPRLDALVRQYRATAWHEEESRWRFAVQALTLRSFLRDHGIRYLFFDALCTNTPPDGLEHGGQLADHYLGFGRPGAAMAELLDGDPANWSGRHPSEAGHARWAQRIHDALGPLDGARAEPAALAAAGLPELGGNATVARHDVKDGDRTGMRTPGALRAAGMRVRHALRKDPFLYP